MTCTHTRMDRHMIYKWYGDRPQPQRHNQIATNAKRHTATNAQRHTATHAQRHTATPAQRHTATPAQRHTATHAQRHTATHAQRHRVGGTNSTSTYKQQYQRGTSNI